MKKPEASFRGRDDGVHAKILMVEDDPDVVAIARTWLEREGYEVAAVADSNLESFGALLLSHRPDLLVLDIRLPGVSGVALCQELRRHSSLPVLMLSSLDDPLDRIGGLEAGADDYLTKPFHPKELVARVRAILRRERLIRESLKGENESLDRGPLSLEPAALTARLDGENLDLTPTEFGLLAALAQHPGQVLSRERLLVRVWGDDFYGSPRVVDTHIGNLRKKLGSRPDLVEAVRGVGYRFRADC